MDSVDLDISWIENHERMNNIHKNYQREPMDSIKMCYIYVNLDSEIEKVVCENEILSKFDNSDTRIIPKERVLQIVQNKKMLNETLKYSMDSILVYNVSIEPENIQKYVNSENGVLDGSPYNSTFFGDKDNLYNGFKMYPIVDEILIHPSIFIFHEINCIYLIFKQTETKTLPKTLPKSILKTEGTAPNMKKTKRVRIQDAGHVIKKTHNITKKNWNS